MSEKTLLIVYASPNIAVGKYSSITRGLADAFETEWLQTHETESWKVVRRDLETTHPQVLDRHWAICDKNPETYKYSDEVIAEFKSADAVLVATPVHNFSASALLKLYTDNLTRLGSTHVPACCKEEFNDPAHPWEGGLDDGTKPVYLVVSSMWDYSEGSPLASKDHLVPWFKDAMDLVGVTNIHVIRSSNELVYSGKESKETLLGAARTRIKEAIEKALKIQVAPRKKRQSPCAKCAARACPCGWPACSGCDQSETPETTTPNETPGKTPETPSNKTRLETTVETPTKKARTDV
eukprot:Gregarina_sp_Pseudo_9__638@NODE_1406_length_1626_cov_19_185255_g1308_i0_p1_GENE_NODE_1406_length_1626_cov_19_185255_g1308_i0NODE_1406_length_1626_cov_19_185255_g1308_i0_p1_ORF_typecomplete_len295_score56_09Flavodoxin_2/PF02525_17/4_1e23FMN_red/PF03358_15/4e09_NODE_1406_length_1626_cov_19_185255_g1308_i079963